MRQGALQIGMIWVILGWLWGGPGLAAEGKSAEEPDVAVLGIVQSDGSHKTVNKSVGEAVVQRLWRMGERVWPKSLDSMRCELADDGCIAKAAGPIRLRELIYGEIQAQSGAKTYELTLRRVDQGGKELAAQKGRCASCEPAALAARAAWLAGALYDRPMPLPELQKEPEPAVAKQPAAPVVQPVAPVVVAQPAQQAVTIVPKSTDDLRHPRWTAKKAALAGVFGTLGVVSLVTGGVFAGVAATNERVAVVNSSNGTYGFSTGGMIGVAAGSFGVAVTSWVIFGWAVEKRGE